ncbi:MAG: hypothetical protein Q8P53_02910 [Candidatus Shapirobacteria bacterium]|nr:hypothetical protein [Candidatus Shapirobacteria bacterium]
MRYYRIILSISIFVLFVFLFSVPIKTLAIEITTDLPTPEVQTTPVSTGSTTVPTTPAPTKISEFMSIWGSFINFFKSFTKSYAVQPNNPPSLTNFGDINNSENTYDSVTRSTDYSDQLSQKNQYISDVINGIYEDKNMSSCPSDSDITIKKVAFYLIKVKNTSLNVESQKETDFLNSPEFINFSIDPSLYSCYDQIYDQFPSIPQGGENNAENAAGSQQLNNSLRRIMPDREVGTAVGNNNDKNKYTNQNNELQKDAGKFMSPENFTVKDFTNLRPAGWQ